MAVDTREKRQSAFSLLVPSLTPGVEPSSIDAAERQAAAWVYAGILAGEPVVPVISNPRTLLTLLVGR